jgi:DNA primase
MARIPQQFIEELLGRADIVELIDKRVPLKKQGREFAACCPFHNEKSPSFYVSPVKQFYHCFGCGAHGTALSFLIEYDHMEFREAVQELASMVGMEVPQEQGESQVQGVSKAPLYEVLDRAASFYKEKLKDSQVAIDYLKNRGLTGEIARDFGLGFAPAGWDNLLKAVGDSDERRRHLLETGMLIEKAGEHPFHDRFRERIMFPIRDRAGRIVGFGGRVIVKEEPKYLNSPETPLFHKGRELYGLYEACQALRNIPRLLVVEGYMDVVALAQYGVRYAVATLGTSTTEEHLKKLFRVTPEVVFCFDGDRAGRAAAWKALESALPRLRDGRQAYFLFLPDGEDPDSLVRKEGRDGFEQRIKQATPLSDYFFNELSHDVEMGSLDGRARLAERARPLIAKLPDGAFRDLMAQELEKRSGARAMLQADPAAHRAVQRPVAVQRSLVRSAISLLLAQPGLADLVEKPYRFLSLDKPGVGLLAELLDIARSRPGINSAMLVEHFAERPEYPSLQKLMAALSVGEPEIQRLEFMSSLERMEHQSLIQRRNALSARREQLSDEEKVELRTLLPLREQMSSKS